MEIVVILIFAALMAFKTWNDISEPPGPSRFTMSMWAQSAKERNLTPKQREEELRMMGWIK